MMFNQCDFCPNVITSKRYRVSPRAHRYARPRSPVTTKKRKGTNNPPSPYDSFGFLIQNYHTYWRGRQRDRC